MPFLFGGFTEEETEEEKVASEEEEVSSEEEEEASEASPEDGDKSTAFVPELAEIEAEEKLEFYRRTREIFVNEWLNSPGNWLSELDKTHLDFLRDIMGVQSNYSPSIWPSYTPGDWSK